ncbi:MAG: DUF4177 domain-containing protein [Anaerolineales bacterium]
MTVPAYPLWEYRVEEFGGILKREPKKEELQAILNSWGEEGWEVVSTVYSDNTSRLRIIAKRLLTHATRRSRSMPGLDGEMT